MRTSPERRYTAHTFTETTLNFYLPTPPGGFGTNSVYATTHTGYTACVRECEIEEDGREGYSQDYARKFHFPPTPAGLRAATSWSDDIAKERNHSLHKAGYPFTCDYKAAHVPAY